MLLIRQHWKNGDDRSCQIAFLVNQTVDRISLFISPDQCHCYPRWSVIKSCIGIHKMYQPSRTSTANSHYALSGCGISRSCASRSSTKVKILNALNVPQCNEFKLGFVPHGLSAIQRSSRNISMCPCWLDGE